MKKASIFILTVRRSVLITINLLGCEPNHNDGKCDVCGDKKFTKLNGDGCEYCYDCYLDAIEYYLK